MFLILLILLLVIVGAGAVLYIRKKGEVDRGNFNLFVPYLDKFNVFEKDENGGLNINTYDEWALFLRYYKEICDFATNTRPTKFENWYHPNLEVFEGCGNKAYDDMIEDIKSIDNYRTDGDITGVCSVSPILFKLLPEEEQDAINEECDSSQ